MARPGMKTPPRHAVVVRVGDAPLNDDIPVARPSVPPPPPSERAETPSEKITARAIPRASTPAPPAVAASPLSSEAEARHERELKMTIPSSLPGELARVHVVESVPPPSDAPMVSHLRDGEGPPSRRASSSLWPIAAAAAAGLVLGLATVATRMHASGAAAPAAMATLESAPVAAAQPPPSVAVRPLAPTPALSASAAPVKERAPQISRPVSPAAASPGVVSPGAKRSIF